MCANLKTNSIDIYNTAQCLLKANRILGNVLCGIRTVSGIDSCCKLAMSTPRFFVYVDTVVILS